MVYDFPDGADDDHNLSSKGFETHCCDLPSIWHALTSRWDIWSQTILWWVYKLNFVKSPEYFWKKSHAFWQTTSWSHRAATAAISMFSHDHIQTREAEERAWELYSSVLFSYKVRKLISEGSEQISSMECMAVSSFTKGWERTLNNFSVTAVQSGRGKKGWGQVANKQVHRSFYYDCPLGGVDDLNLWVEEITGEHQLIDSINTFSLTWSYFKKCL